MLEQERAPNDAVPDLIMILMEEERGKRDEDEVNLNLIILLLFVNLLSALAVQPIQSDRIASGGIPDGIYTIHAKGLATGLRVFQKLPELLLANLDRLRGGSVGHAEHGAPQVEGVSDVGGSAQKEKEDEIDWVIKNYYEKELACLRCQRAGLIE